MKPVSIVIPTAYQPRFLQTALQSVSRQTAIEEVEEIIVSDNSGTGDAEKVCSQFSHLPIKYIFHASPLPILEHFLYVYRQSQAKLVAFLCDDDWWAPGHLQTALLDLTNSPEAVAWFSAHLYLQSEDARDGWISRTAILWLAADKPEFTLQWYLRPHEVVAASAVLSPFHLSTMVVHRMPLLRAAEGLKGSHHHQYDQYLWVALSRNGPILYDPLVDTFVQWHGTNYAMRASSRERQQASRECTEAIWERARHDGVDLTVLWQHHLAQVSKDVMDEVGNYFRIAMADDKLAERGFAQFIPPGLPIRLLRNGARFYRRIARYLRHELFSAQ